MKVEPKTGWGEGRSPELFKADRREARSLGDCGSCSLSLVFGGFASLVVSPWGGSSLSWRLWFMLSLSLWSLVVFGGPLVFGGFAVLWFISLLARGPVVWFLVLWSDPFVGGVGR